MGAGTAEILRSLFDGFLVTIEYFVMTLVLSLPLGLVICFGSMSSFKPLKWLTKTFVWIIRGTPLMLQILIVFFGPGLLFGVRVPNGYRETAALIAFVINYAAYFSEIYRAGLESIPKGQYEAIQVLGMTERQGFFKVILFQVVRHIVPPMGNEIITLVKDTSLVRVIAITELIKSAEYYTKMGLIWPLFFTAIFYLLFSGLLSVLLSKLEKKMNYYSI